MPSATALASAKGLPKSSHRESDDAYGGVIAVLNSRWRVIACRDRIQWIVQFGKKKRGGSVWESQSFCRSREGLLRAVSAHAGPVDPIALAILDQLPARFPEGAL